MKENNNAKMELKKELNALRKELEKSALNDTTKHKQLEEKYPSFTKDILDASTVGIFILDSDFKVVWINNVIESYFALQREKIIGKDKRQLIKKNIQHIFEDPDEFIRKVFATYDDNTYIENFECHVLPEGKRKERWLEHWSQTIKYGLYAGGRIEHYYDITAHKQVKKSLKQSEIKLKSILNTMSDYCYIIDKDFKIEFMNKSMIEKFGNYTGKICYKEFFNYNSPCLWCKSKEIQKGKTVKWERFYSEWGATFEVIDAPFENRDGTISKLAIGRDISEHKQTEEKLTYMATHDILTSLPNRTLFDDRLTLAIAQAKRNQKKLAVMLFDLDRFKDVNDTMGHRAGDQLLKEVGKRTGDLLRKSDTIARMGGDEFLLLLPEISQVEDAIKIARKIINAFKKSFLIDHHKVHITPSIGIVIYPENGENADTLIKNADITMYQAKEQGRSNYKLYKSVYKKQTNRGNRTKYNFSDLIDIKQIQIFMNNFCKVTGVASAIIDLNGEVLISSRWQRICTDFHRVNVQTCKKCIESDTILANQLLKGKKYALYKCKNGLIDAAAPIVVEGKHITNMFIGQFLYKPPNIEFFRKQALQYGFNEISYLKALSRVPIIPKENIKPILSYLSNFTELLGEIGLKQINQLEAHKGLRANEAKLRESEERLSQIIKGSSAPTFVINNSHVVTHWNKACESLTGITASEVIGTDKQWTAFYSKKRPVIADIIVDKATGKIVNGYYHGKYQESVLINGAYQAEDFFIHMGKDGKWLFFTAAPLKNSKGEIIGAIETLQDVTERKQTQQALQKSHDELELRVKERTAQLEASMYELEAFAYSVSHDLQAPLRAISGFSEILLKDYLDTLDDKGQHYLQRVRAGTVNMSQMIEDLLTLSRIGRRPINKKRVDIEKLVKETYELLSEAERKDRKVDFTIKPCPPVLSDPQLLKIVLTNLFSNALKFTRKCKKAEIEFGCKTEDKKTIFYIKDNGIGFDMKYADKLFAPFQRLHKEEEYEGSGIGLATVQRIIRRHGGEIRAESIPGSGSTFYFTL